MGKGCTLPDLCVLWEEHWPGDLEIWMCLSSVCVGGGVGGKEGLAGLFSSDIFRINTGQRRQRSSGKTEGRTLLPAQLADTLGSPLTLQSQARSDQIPERNEEEEKSLLTCLKPLTICKAISHNVPDTIFPVIQAHRFYYRSRSER